MLRAIKSYLAIRLANPGIATVESRHIFPGLLSVGLRKIRASCMAIVNCEWLLNINRKQK